MEPQKIKMKRKINSNVRSMADDDLIFNLDEEHTSDLTQSHSSPMQAVSSHSIRESGSLKFKNKSALASSSRPKFSSLRLEKHIHTNDVSRRKSDKSFFPNQHILLTSHFILSMRPLKKTSLFFFVFRLLFVCVCVCYFDSTYIFCCFFVALLIQFGPILIKIPLLYANSFSQNAFVGTSARTFWR